MNRDIAHAGMTAKPSTQPDVYCGGCHAEIVEDHVQTLHFDAHGEYNVLTRRADTTDATAMAALDTAFQNHCASCHGTCGTCHVSRPHGVEGGFLSGHRFKATQSFVYTCTACHGTRVGNEYRGLNEGYTADVHWSSETMTCTACHDVAEMHGNGVSYEDRYHAAPAPSCTDCHAVEADGNEFHAAHAEPNRGGGDFAGKSLTCHTCHSIAYKNCFSCHVGIDDEDILYFRTAESEMNLKIGRNTIQGSYHPEDYTLVRHIPVDADSFEYYGADLLPFYDDEPTWKFTTPHNIHRATDQALTCAGCHHDSSLFLTEDDVETDELDANADVMIEYDCENCHDF